MERRAGYLVKLVQQLLRQHLDNGLRELGLTAPQYAVLTAIERAPGISNAELARLAFLTPQTMQGILVNLEKLGMIERRPAPDHGRVLRSELTSPGRVALKRAHRIVNDVEQKMLEGLGSQDLGELTRLLSHCATRLQQGSR